MEDYLLIDELDNPSSYFDELSYIESLEREIEEEENNIGYQFNS